MLRLRFADGTHAPRLLHEDTRAAAALAGGAPPVAHGSSGGHWCVRTPEAGDDASAGDGVGGGLHVRPSA